MSQYAIIRRRTGKRSVVAGMALTLLAHVAAFVLVSVHGLTYIWPPAQEQSLLLDFTEVEETVKPHYGREPVAPKVDRTKPVELVRKSKSPVAQTVANTTQAAAPDDFGDVDSPTPKVEPAIDPRASFPGMGKKPSDAGTPHSADKASETFRDGQVDGNSANAAVDGKSNAHLQGRRVDGNLIKPGYRVQKSGVVVVKILVDVYGNVRSAEPGMPGTTLDDKTLWQEARNAAMKTHFTPVSDIANAPPLQEGTIKYIFNLK